MRRSLFSVVFFRLGPALRQHDQVRPKEPAFPLRATVVLLGFLGPGVFHSQPAFAQAAFEWQIERMAGSRKPFPAMASHSLRPFAGMPAHRVHDISLAAGAGMQTLAAKALRGAGSSKFSVECRSDVSHAQVDHDFHQVPFSHRHAGDGDGPPLTGIQHAIIEGSDARGAAEGGTARASSGLATMLLVALIIGGAVMAIVMKLFARWEREEEVRQIYRAATDAAKEGFYMLRPLYSPQGVLFDFQFEDVNRRGGFLLGTDRHQLLGKPASQLLLPLVFNDLLDLIQKALDYTIAEDERRIAAEAQLPSKWLHRRAVKVGPGVALTLRDITETKEHEEALLELAYRDALTGLPNRGWLQHSLPKAIHRARRAHRQLAILFIDLDHFKHVNDTLGHDAGDALLKEVTTRLREVVRVSDQVIRLGGDEFLVVIENVVEASSIEEVAHKIIGSLNERFAPMSGALGKVSASIGISLFPQDGQTPEELLKHADIAMYQSKAQGRGRVCWYRPEFSSQLTERIDNEHALRMALERHELVVHYQPKFRAQSGRLSGVEALVRWQRPEHGLVMPDAFIELAEQTGLIIAVGECVIQTVVAQMAAWQSAGLPQISVSINVSPVQLRRSDVAAFLRQQLQLHQVAPGLLDIEITESAVVERSESVQSQLAKLRELGVRLVIDDFGAGYSSLSQLQLLDVDVLKMDRGLIEPLRAGSSAESLCRAIVRMASALHLEVVSEGVETFEQLVALREIGTDELQGFLLARPMSADMLESQLIELLDHPPCSADSDQDEDVPLRTAEE